MDSNEESGVLEEKIFERLGINDIQKSVCRAILKSMKERDSITYYHSINIEILSEKVGKFISYKNPDFRINDFSLAGLLHDTGKVYTDKYSLGKIQGFNRKDRKEMSRHPIDGYGIISLYSIYYNDRVLDFCAQIALRHHRYNKKEPYPERRDIKEFEKNISKENILEFEYYSKILNRIDFYKALRRNNDKYKKNGRIPNSVEAREIILSDFPEDREFIEELYNAGIFE